MSDNKKYYYLRLKDTFFDSEEMKILESQKNGILYQNIYLKMCLLSVKNNGALTFKDVMPYDVAMLSTVLRIDIDSVKTAIEIFIKLGLVVISDNETMYMADIQSLIGQSSTEADRIKEYRNKIKCTKDVQMLQNCTPEIELKTEKEKEKERKYTTSDEVAPLPEIKQRKIKHKHGEYNNVLLTDDELYKLTQELGIEKVKKVIDYYSECKEMKGYTYKSDYLAILKWGIKAYAEHHPDEKTEEKQEKKIRFNSNPCPECGVAKMWEEDTKPFFHCENCGKTMDSEQVYKYIRKLHGRE